MNALLRFGIALVAILAATAQGSTAEVLKIRIGWSTMPTNMIPVLYSAKPEILRHYGQSYTVELMQFRGSVPQVTAMAAGEIDIASFAPLSLALAVHNFGMDVKAVADMLQDGVPGRNSLAFLVRKDSGITSVADLKGKRIGMNALGSASDTALKAMLRKAGMSPRDCIMVEATFPNIPARLEEGKIDLGPVLQPYKNQLLATGRYDVLFEAKDALGPVQFVFLAARTDFLEKNREALYDFFEDHVRAMRWFADPSNHAEAVNIVAKYMHRPAADLDYLFTKDDFYRDPYLFPNVDGIQKMADVSFEVGLMPANIEVSPKYVDKSFVAEAKRRIDAASQTEN